MKEAFPGTALRDSESLSSGFGTHLAWIRRLLDRVCRRAYPADPSKLFTLYSLRGEFGSDRKASVAREVVHQEMGNSARCAKNFYGKRRYANWGSGAVTQGDAMLVSPVDTATGRALPALVWSSQLLIEGQTDTNSQE